MSAKRGSIIRCPKSLPPALRKKEERLDSHERITVILLDAIVGEAKVIERAPDRMFRLSKLINCGRPVPEKDLHVMSVKVGTVIQKEYAFMYTDYHGVDTRDETVVFRTQDKDGNNLFYGIPCGCALIFTYDNRRVQRKTRPGTLSAEDVDFLKAHIFKVEGHVFLMAQADKKY